MRKRKYTKTYIFSYTQTQSQSFQYEKTYVFHGYTYVYDLWNCAYALLLYIHTYIHKHSYIYIYIFNQYTVALWFSWCIRFNKKCMKICQLVAMLLITVCCTQIFCCHQQLLCGHKKMGKVKQKAVLTNKQRQCLMYCGCSSVPLDKIRQYSLCQG